MFIKLILTFIFCHSLAHANAPHTIETSALKSKALAKNLINLNPQRQVWVYLPPSYKVDLKRTYPVIYYISNHRRLLEDKEFIDLIERAVTEQRIGEFILVSGDFSIPGSMNFFGNGPTSGYWLDHIAKELVPFVDKHYRTIKKPSARGISGHFLGGYAALKSAMFYPETFGSVYALHPVGTDTGETLMRSRPDWREINTAESLDELTGYSIPFVAMAQAHSPNPEKPPFYADFMVEIIDGMLVPNSKNIRTLRHNFLLADRVPEYANNLRKLRAIKFDWGRYDENQDHVYANQKLTRLLDDYGVSHEAEEFGGNGWDYDFTTNGRIYWNFLPFFNRNLEFK